MRRGDAQAQPSILPLEQLQTLSLQELHRYAERTAAEAEAAMARYSELRRSPLGTAADAIEAAHAAWRAQYQLRDQLVALIQTRERAAVKESAAEHPSK